MGGKKRGMGWNDSVTHASRTSLSFCAVGWRGGSGEDAVSLFQYNRGLGSCSWLNKRSGPLFVMFTLYCFYVAYKTYVLCTCVSIYLNGHEITCAIWSIKSIEPSRLVCIYWWIRLAKQVWMFSNEVDIFKLIKWQHKTCQFEIIENYSCTAHFGFESCPDDQVSVIKNHQQQNNLWNIIIIAYAT